MESYIGQIIAVGFKFEPLNWMVCDGRLLDIQQYSPLFQLIGTTYGGDGNVKFAIPDLRGRLAVHQGQGFELSNYTIGQNGGEEYHQLSSGEFGHTHPLMATVRVVNDPTKPIKTPTPVTPTPSSTVALTTNLNNKVQIYDPGPPDTPFNLGALYYAGQGIPHENRQSFQVINYIICVQGIYPTRD
jgi:microcystin-dependent protein